MVSDHPGIVVKEPIGALARLGPPALWSPLGDTARACAAYQDFFTLWKVARVPILRAAKPEFVRLQ